MKPLPARYFKDEVPGQMKSYSVAFLLSYTLRLFRAQLRPTQVTVSIVTAERHLDPRLTVPSFMANQATYKRALFKHSRRSLLSGYGVLTFGLTPCSLGGCSQR